MGTLVELLGRSVVVEMDLMLYPTEPMVAHDGMHASGCMIFTSTDGCECTMVDVESASRWVFAENWICDLLSFDGLIVNLYSDSLGSDIENVGNVSWILLFSPLWVQECYLMCLAQEKMLIGRSGM